jgi:sialidase-1
MWYRSMGLSAGSSALIVSTVALLAGLASPVDAAPPEQIDVFARGQDGYHTYRIPAVVVTTKGTVLAFCEGRKNNQSDHGDVDLVLKRSFDGGKTWGPQQLVYEEGDTAKVTIGNPCPVVDRTTGVIWLPFCRENDRVFVTRSNDDGATWSRPVEITPSVKDPSWSWYATGPGCGIQLKGGRLVIPCDHKVGTPQVFRSHVIYSDDHGATWKLGGILGENTNECQVVERQDGSLLLNMRSYHKKNRRAIATSKDGGLTWSEVTLDPALIEPVCQASLVRFSEKGPGRLLFSNPASTRREKMTVRLSEDDGRTWPVAKLLHEGPAAYSALVVLPDGTVGCLYERGAKSSYDKITFARFTLDWLTEGPRSR